MSHTLIIIIILENNAATLCAHETAQGKNTSQKRFFQQKFQLNSSN